MTCPLCGQRSAKRSCPALNQPICAVCCATKREVEIACPATCQYLASGREHPSATAVRRQQEDFDLFASGLRDLSERQRRLFLDVSAFLAGYKAPELQTVIDDDVTQAVEALAATLETAARGVIFDHQPRSLPAARLLMALRPVVSARTPGQPTLSDALTAVVLRRMGELIARRRAGDPGNDRAYLALLVRLALARPPGDDPTAEEPRLIVP